MRSLGCFCQRRFLFVLNHYNTQNNQDKSWVASPSAVEAEPGETSGCLSFSVRQLVALHGNIRNVYFSSDCSPLPVPLKCILQITLCFCIIQQLSLGVSKNGTLLLRIQTCNVPHTAQNFWTTKHEVKYVTGCGAKTCSVSWNCILFLLVHITQCIFFQNL